jgi:F0F1-type ATP synthase membrane subunit b/b'
MALFLFSIGAATLVILVVLVISLFRQVRRLSGAIREFSSEVTPALEDIQREGDRAQVLAERIERRQRERDRQRERGPNR